MPLAQLLALDRRYTYFQSYYHVANIRGIDTGIIIIIIITLF
jgi:hypothetical protein